MPMNRVQFQAGLSMPEFLERYGTEDKCRAALQAARWPKGFVCPACGGAARTRFERGGLRYWQCGGCQRQTSLISGTIFEASKLPLSRWFLAMQLLTQSKNNVSALELRRQLGVSYRSAWLMKHKILEAMRVAEGDRKLDGHLNCDSQVIVGVEVSTSGSDMAQLAPMVEQIEQRLGSRSCISRRARCWAAALRRLSCAGSASICSLSSRTRARASSRLSCRLALRLNEAAPALARTRTPSCATHCSFTAPALISAARLTLSNSSSA